MILLLRMKLRNLFLRSMLSLGLLAGSVNAEYKPLFGVCHGPFREGQSPELQIFPSEQEVREDIYLNDEVARTERTYGCDNILFDIPRFCYEEGIDCYAGGWFDPYNSSNDQQTVNSLMDIANQRYETTKALIVGNEFLLAGGTKNRLISLINQVNDSTDVPVTTGETYDIWMNNPELVPEVDFIGIHVHPYWEGVDVNDAARFVVDKYNLIKNTYYKEAAILETGWPTKGNTHENAVPSEENQRIFLEDFKNLAEQNNIKYFIFEGFDEPWKEKYGEVEGSWGLFYENRTLKPCLEDLLNTNPCDFNEDGRVDEYDLNELCDKWLMYGDDLSGNNFTDFKDFSVFANSWRWEEF